MFYQVSENQSSGLIKKKKAAHLEGGERFRSLQSRNADGLGTAMCTRFRSRGHKLQTVKEGELDPSRPPDSVPRDLPVDTPWILQLYSGDESMSIGNIDGS